MSEELFLSLDQGGGSSRAMVFTARGQLVASAKVAVATRRPAAQWVEQDPSDIVSSLHHVAAQAIGQLNSSQRNSLVGCALVCQRSSLVCWHSDSGDALSPIISWQDTRASDWLASQSFDDEMIYRITGLFPNAHFGASKMRWCLQHYDGVIDAANKGRLCLAPLASYLANQLLDQSPFIVDPVNASRTLLMNLECGDWDKSLLTLFAIDSACLPDIVSNQSFFGTLTICGLCLPLMLLTGDQSAAAFANGEPGVRNGYLNIGTGAFIYRPLALSPHEYQVADKLLRSVLHWPDTSRPPQRIVEGTINGAGSALQWFADNNAIDDLNKYFDGLSNNVIGSTDNPFFLNGIGGLGSPDWVADFPSQFIGEGGRQEKFVAILESIIFLIARNFALMNNDGKVEKLVIGGGLGQSDEVCQTISNLLAVTVERPVECEASARGAAFLVAGRPKNWLGLDSQYFYPKQEPAIARRFEQWSTLMQQHLPTNS